MCETYIRLSLDFFFFFSRSSRRFFPEDDLFLSRVRPVSISGVVSFPVLLREPKPSLACVPSGTISGVLHKRMLKNWYVQNKQVV